MGKCEGEISSGLSATLSLEGINLPIKGRLFLERGCSRTGPPMMRLFLNLSCGGARLYYYYTDLI